MNIRTWFGAWSKENNQTIIGPFIHISKLHKKHLMFIFFPMCYDMLLLSVLQLFYDNSFMGQTSQDQTVIKVIFENIFHFLSTKVVRS